MLFRHKPTVVEAWQWNGLGSTDVEIPSFVGHVVGASLSFDAFTKVGIVLTIEISDDRRLTLLPGDWICRRRDRIWVVEREDFMQMYEPTGGDPDA